MIERVRPSFNFLSTPLDAAERIMVAQNTDLVVQHCKVAFAEHDYNLMCIGQPPGSRGYATHQRNLTSLRLCLVNRGSALHYQWAEMNREMQIPWRTFYWQIAEFMLELDWESTFYQTTFQYEQTESEILSYENQWIAKKVAGMPSVAAVSEENCHHLMGSCGGVLDPSHPSGQWLYPPLSLPSATLMAFPGTSDSKPMKAFGGTPPYVYEIVSVPASLDVDIVSVRNGVALAIVPASTAVGAYVLAVQVTDAAGDVVGAVVTLVVKELPSG